MKWVVDASVAVKPLLREPASDLAVRVLADDTGAPDLLFPEAANVIWKAHRRGLIDLERAREAAILLSQLELEIIPCGPFTTRALSLAVHLDHPAYDCFYLALAMHRGVPLITADDALVRKVKRSDVSADIFSLTDAVG